MTGIASSATSIACAAARRKNPVYWRRPGLRRSSASISSS
jgi:hypothetical protein